MLNNKLKPFKLCVLQNFPFIEADFDALTNYQLLCKVVEFLNKTIDSQNEVIEEFGLLHNAFLELKNYVEDYLKNHLKEDVDAKLDEMAEDGTLETIISKYIDNNLKRIYNSLELLKQADLSENIKVQTLGYYSINDGGGANYIIRNTTPSGYYETLDNGKFAELIIYKNEINVLTFGVKGDGTTNDTQNIQKSSNYATSKGYNLYFPNKTYLTDTITIENVKNLTIDGEIKLTTDQESINVFENVNGSTAKIFINKVTIGNIIMKGLNSADVTIQNAYKLILLADNTPGHNFIGYTKFNLGYIRTLELNDDGTQSKWINENLFLGGRFQNLTIGGGNSVYPHQNNLFLKPMCENTKITFNTGIGNRIIDARLEGNSTEITFAEDTYANVITSNFAQTLQGYLNPKYFNNLTVNDASLGKNKVISNEDKTEHKVLSLNAFYNPKNITVENDALKPGGNIRIYESGLLELPKSIIQLYLNTDNKNLYWRIECYNENREKLNYNPNLLINSPVLSYASDGTYGNVTFNRNTYWAIFDPTNTDVKYIKVSLSTPANATNELYKNIEMFLSYYGKLENEGYYIEGLKI